MAPTVTPVEFPVTIELYLDPIVAPDLHKKISQAVCDGFYNSLPEILRRLWEVEPDSTVAVALTVNTFAIPEALKGEEGENDPSLKLETN